MHVVNWKMTLDLQWFTREFSYVWMILKVIILKIKGLNVILVLLLCVLIFSQLFCASVYGAWAYAPKQLTCGLISLRFYGCVKAMAGSY